MPLPILVTPQCVSGMNQWQQWSLTVMAWILSFSSSDSSMLTLDQSERVLLIQKEVEVSQAEVGHQRYTFSSQFSRRAGFKEATRRGALVFHIFMCKIIIL